jgi:hypothetical protein
MKKATLAALITGLMAISVNPAHTQEPKTIAIIDTAIDSSRMPNVVYEACFTYNNTCKNKSRFDEGKGSASINDWKIKGALHGFSMAQAAIQVDPNVKIVFLRISDEKVYDTFSMIRNDGGSMARALEWVSNNSARFNISAVSISQSRSNFKVGSCPTDALFESSVKKLKVTNVPTFVATGNDSKNGMDPKLPQQIGFPACVPGVYSVAAMDLNKNVVKSSNIDSNTTLLAPACLFNAGASTCVEVKDYFGVSRPITGTSAATVFAATLAVSKNISGSFDTFLQTLPKNGLYRYISK